MKLLNLPVQIFLTHVAVEPTFTVTKDHYSHIVFAKYKDILTLVESTEKHRALIKSSGVNPRYFSVRTVITLDVEGFYPVLGAIKPNGIYCARILAEDYTGPTE